MAEKYGIKKTENVEQPIQEERGISKYTIMNGLNTIASGVAGAGAGYLAMQDGSTQMATVTAGLAALLLIGNAIKKGRETIDALTSSQPTEQYNCEEIVTNDPKAILQTAMI